MPVPAAAALTAAGQIGAGFAQASAKPAQNKLSQNANRTPINVQPVGLNLGSILAPVNQGPPNNGGSGTIPPSRYVASDFGRGLSGRTSLSLAGGRQSSPGGIGVVPLVLLAVGGVAAIFLLRRRG